MKPIRSFDFESTICNILVLPWIRLLTHVVPGRTCDLAGVTRVSPLFGQGDPDIKRKPEGTESPCSATSPKLTNQIHLFPCRGMEMPQCFLWKVFLFLFFQIWKYEAKRNEIPC